MRFGDYFYWTRKPWQKTYEAAEDVLHATIGLSDEAGEVLGVIKKHRFTPGRLADTPENAEREAIRKLKDELGDVLFYWCRAVDELGLTPEDIMEHNHDKLKRRWEA